MPPTKVWVFIGSIIFILLVGLLFWDPENTKQIPCPTGTHSHDGAPEHCI
jgi:hypothetical protein